MVQMEAPLTTSIEMPQLLLSPAMSVQVKNRERRFSQSLTTDRLLREHPCRH